VSGALPRISPLGDAAVTVAFADRLDPAARRQVLALHRELARRPLAGTIELVAAMTTLTIYYDPLEVDYQTTRAAIRLRLDARTEEEESSHRRLVVIPVRYDGPDLNEVAARTGLTPDAIAARHSAREYEVLLLGFVPGWAYLGELDPSLVLPRRASPRERVPPGSVAIAGQQTGIYPAATPGGWHLIGTTRERMFDPNRTPASLLAVGDRVRFVPEPS
jgi:inhibitor of KinA